MALEKEIKTYESHLPALLTKSGKFVLIQEADIVGVYETYDDALTIGYERFGLDPFLVKRIQSDQREQLLSVI